MMIKFALNTGERRRPARGLGEFAADGPDAVEIVDVELNEQVTDTPLVVVAVASLLKQFVYFTISLQCWTTDRPIGSIEGFGPGEQVLNIE